MYVLVRNCQYPDNIVERDHRGIQGRCRPMREFNSSWSAAGTLAGIRLAHPIGKRRRIVDATPAMATVRPSLRRRRSMAFLWSGRTYASMSAMPSLRATDSAVARSPPVTITIRMESRLSRSSARGSRQAMAGSTARISEPHHGRHLRFEVVATQPRGFRSGGAGRRITGIGCR